MATLLPIEDRLLELEVIGTERPFTSAERGEWERLSALAHQRKVRASKQLIHARALAETYMARLSPADRLRERRRDVSRAIEALRSLEDELEPGLRLVALETELCIRRAA